MTIKWRKDQVDEKLVEIDPEALARINAWIPKLDMPTGSEPLTWDDLVQRSVDELK